VNRDECKQQIIDRALAWMAEDTEEFSPWTAKDLGGAISEFKWNAGHPIDFDLGFLADTINARWKERCPTPRPRPAKEETAEADPEAEGPVEEGPNGTPFLLPIAGMDGYSVDHFGRVHAEKRQGRKGGPMTPDKFFASKGKGQKPRFVCGYKVRVGGKRKRYRPNYFLMARFFAEQKWLNGEV
jgi:hypothetical protein